MPHRTRTPTPPNAGTRRPEPPAARSGPATRGRSVGGCTDLDRFVVIVEAHGIALLAACVERSGQRGLAQSPRSEEHTSELQSRENLVCRLLLEKKKGTDEPEL